MKFKIKPWEHQLKGIELATPLDYFALLYLCGKGKTATAISIYRQKCYKHNELLRALIICPLGVVYKWKKEFAAHSYFDNNEITVLDGTAARRIKKLQEGKKILIINTDGVSIKELWNEVKKFAPQFMIIDESHCFKNPSAKRTHQVINISDSIKYKLILTGTFACDELDVWSQYRILNKNIFGENFFVFRNTYFYDANAGMPRERYFPNWKPHKHMQNEVEKRINSCAHIVMDTHDMPDLLRLSVNVPLGKKQAKLYKEMRDDFVTYMNDDACEASTALVKGLRLQQLVSGIFVTDEGQSIPLEDNLRNKILAETLESIPKGACKVIWCIFRDSYKQVEAVVKKLGYNYDFIIGGQKAITRQDIIDGFNKSDTNCIIANQAAGGTGVDLLGTDEYDTIYSIYYSRNFSWVQNEQSEFRIRRKNQKKKCVRIDLVAENTIDEDALEALKHKDKTSKIILGLKDKI